MNFRERESSKLYTTEKPVTFSSTRHSSVEVRIFTLVTLGMACLCLVFFCFLLESKCILSQSSEM